MTHQRERPAPLEGGNGPTSVTMRKETRPRSYSMRVPESPTFTPLQCPRDDGTNFMVERDRHSGGLRLSVGRADREKPDGRFVLGFVFLNEDEIVRVAEAMHAYARRRQRDRERGGR
jgi:hypothetical protein